MLPVCKSSNSKQEILPKSEIFSASIVCVPVTPVRIFIGILISCSGN